LLVQRLDRTDLGVETAVLAAPALARTGRAGGMGLITGRKVFHKSMADGIELVHGVQDVYLSPEVTVA
jgi:DhnA family fructose-bisphosphate aldolase class Ia